MIFSDKRINLRRRRTPARAIAALVTVAAALAAPAAADARLLVETYNEGLQPLVDIGDSSAKVDNPRKIRVELTSSYPAELTGRFTVKCSRHFTKSYPISGISPATRSIKLPPNIGTCLIPAATGHYVDPLLQGWIQIRAWGG